MSYKIATFALTIIIIIAFVHKKASGAQITGKTNLLCVTICISFRLYISLERELLVRVLYTIKGL